MNPSAVPTPYLKHVKPGDSYLDELVVRALFVVLGFLEPVVPLLTVWRHYAFLLAVSEADPGPLHTHKRMDYCLH